MAFIVKPIETLKLPLIIHVPADLGKFDEHDLAVTWKYLDEDARKAIADELNASRREYNAQMKAFGAGDREEPPQVDLNDKDLCARLIVNIEGMLTPDNEEIPYSTDMLDQLFKMNYVAKPLGEQLLSVINGVAAMKELEKS